MDITETKNKIIKFYNSKEYIELSSFYSYKNYFEILKVERDENTHSSFIAWLINPNENHGLGDFPLKKFLLLLCWAKTNLKCNKNSFFSEDLLNSILSNDIEISNTTITREYGIEDKKRIDILIQAKIKIGDIVKIQPIIIENKVNSTENNYINDKKQTEIYYDWAEKTFSSNDYFKPLYVFLLPLHDFELKNSTDLSKKCKCDKYIIINYQALNDYVLEPCMKNKMNDSARTLINNYQRCLSYSEKEICIMATNEDQRKMLRDFWDNNKELLMAALSALGDDPDTLEEDKKDISKALQSISKRDNTKYQFNGDILGKGRLVLAVIKDYVQKHPEITYEELDKAFKNDNKNTLIRTKDIKDEKRYFKDEVLNVNGEEVSVSTQWDLKRIEVFIDVAKKLGYIIIPQTKA